MPLTVSAYCWAMATKQHSIRTRQMRAALAQIPDIHPEHVHGFAAFSEAADRIAELTRELMRAGQLLKIEVLDHVIVANPALRIPGTKTHSSLRELGYFYS